MIKYAKRALLTMLLTAFGASGAGAAVTYNNGDLFLGFRAAGGNGFTKDYLVNVGPASQFTGASAPLNLNLGNIGADLSSSGLYGNSWFGRSDLFWGVSGTVGSFSAVGSDPQKTLYATRARTSKTVQSTPWQRDSDTGQGITTSKINGQANAYTSGTASGNASTAIIQNTSGINSYASFQPGGVNAGPAPGISYQAFNPTIEGSFDPDAGTANSILDLYRLVPSSTQFQDGEYLGFFTISTAGVVTFVPKTVAAITLENSVYTVSEAVQGGKLTINVLRTGDSSGTVTANVSTTDGTAYAGTDYTALTNVPVSFGPGETSKPVQIAIANLANYQGDRSFTVSLSGASNGASFIAPSAATVTIGETSPPPAGVLSFSQATYNVTPLNGASQPNSVTVTVNRASATSDSVTAFVTATGGSLSNGTDYTLNPNPATVTFGPDETTQDVVIPLNAIDASKLPGTINLSLSNPTNGATLGAQTTAIVNVANVGALTFSASTYKGAESANGDTTLTVTVTRNGGASGAASVEVARTSGTATDGVDFTLPAAPVVLNWANNDSSSKTFDITIKADAIAEPVAETIVLALQNVSGATIGTPGTTTVSILDTDTASPVLTITAPAPNAKVSAGNVTISGKVSDNQGVGRVELRIDGGAPVLATVTGSTWTATVTPEPGLHLVQVVAYDLVGNATSIVSRSFTFTNLRPALAGTYNGLILADLAIANQVDYNGLLGVTVTPTGSFTGKGTFNGLTVQLMGTFGTDGVARFTKAGNATALPVIRNGKPDATFIGYLSLTIDAENKRVTGSLKNGLDASATELAAVVDADLATYSKTNKVPTAIVDPTKEKGKYTALFIPHAAPNRGLAAAAFPQGQGYGTVTLTDAGAVTITGKLADGSGYTYKSTLSGTNRVPLFIPLYGNKGYLAGEVKFDSTQLSTDAAGANLRWFKPAALPGQKVYPNGWANGILVDAFGSKYVAPAAGETALSTTANAPVTLDVQLSGGALQTENSTASLAANGQVTGSTSAFGLKLTFLNATGAISGSFAHPENSKTATLQGVVLQKSETAGGYFLNNPSTGTQQSGAVAIGAH
jgi:hypothetical protein